MRIFLNLLLAAMIAAVSVVTWLHTSKEALEVVSTYYHWTPEGRALFDVLAVPITGLSFAAALGMDTKAIFRGWAVAFSNAAGINIAQPSPKDIVDAAAKQAVDAGVPKQHVQELRAQNANEVADKISQLNPPSVDPLTFKELPK